MNEGGLASKITQTTWKGMSSYQRNLFYKKNLIVTNPDSDKLDIRDCELFLMIELDINFDNLVIYETIDHFFKMK